MARVIRFYTPGGPEVMQFEDIIVPEPGPGEIRIEVKALGVNRADVMRRNGTHSEPLTLPGGLGNEATGIIESMGKGVTGFNLGDSVNIIPSFPIDDYPMYGELVLAPVHAVIKQPAALSFVEAASVWMMFLTPYGALIDDAKLASGDVVLISAASSSVGLAAIQLCNMVGAIPVALSRTDKKRQQLLDAGAKHVIATDAVDVTAEIMKITHGKGAQIIFDSVGGPDFLKLMNALAPGGTAYIYGALSEKTTPLPGIEFVVNMQTVKGHNIWKTSGDPAGLKAAVHAIQQGFLSGQLTPVINKVFPFDEVVAAHRYLEQSTHFGKVVMAL